jgi:hypothetical protein
MHTAFLPSDLDWEMIDQSQVIHDVRLAFESSTQDELHHQPLLFCSSFTDSTQTLVFVLQEQLEAIDDELRRRHAEKVQMQVRAEQLQYNGRDFLCHELMQ